MILVRMIKSKLFLRRPMPSYSTVPLRQNLVSPFVAARVGRFLSARQSRICSFYITEGLSLTCAAIITSHYINFKLNIY